MDVHRKKMRKNKMLSESKEIDVEGKPTKTYDAVSKKIRTLLGATAATYIPEVCEALRKDWFFEYTDSEIKNNKDKARDLIRRKIMVDWCKDESSDGVWSTGTIDAYWPTWLKSSARENAGATNLSKAREKLLKKFSITAQEQKRKLDNIANLLPEAPKTEEETIPTPYPTEETESEQDIKPLDDAQIRKLTIHESVTKLTKAEHDLWTALTGKEEMPALGDDPMVDHIRPTRQYRNNIFYELATGGDVFKVSLHGHFKRLNYLIDLLNDAVATIADIEKKEIEKKG